MTYKEKLLDPRWQKKRLSILNRDEFTCKHCNSKDKTLHVHHLDYLALKDPWDYSDEFLLTLCHECHEEETKERPSDEKHILRAIRLKFKDTYSRYCLYSAISQIDNIDNLMYLLKELKDESILIEQFLKELISEKASRKNAQECLELDL